MCGVFAYTGKDDAVRQVINGLKRLEYRGYDSWGMAVLGSDKIEVYKNIGAICEQHSMDLLPPTQVALGHTRWATHGAVNLENCHPHLSSNLQFSVVHNGIVENYQELKQQLLVKGHHFQTETDTEVIVRLIEDYQQQAALYDSDIGESSLLAATQSAFLELEGRNTIVVLAYQNQQFIGIRNGSPLVVGKGESGYFFASDSLSFAEETQQCLMLQDMELINCQSGALQLMEVGGKLTKPFEWQTVNHVSVNVDKEGYPHFMLKEVMEQWSSIANAAEISKPELQMLVDAMKAANHVFLVGAGGAYFAAEQISFLLRTIAQLNALGVRAYELDSFLPLVQPGDVVLAVSQSGETADTLRFLDAVQHKGVTVGCLVNMPGSSMTHLSDLVYYNQSGPEVCVLSTKSCSAQLTFGYLLANAVIEQFEQAKQEIERLSYQLSHYLGFPILEQAAQFAQKIYHHHHLFLLGTGRYFMAAQIAALNIKEASTLHAEAFSGGELKHGVLALIESGTPIVVFLDSSKDKAMINVTAELKSRGAFILGISDEPNELFDEFLPLSGSTFPQASIISDVIPGQLLAYQLAMLRGQNPDRPRNLAKSVTVV